MPNDDYLMEEVSSACPLITICANQKDPAMLVDDSIKLIMFNIIMSWHYLSFPHVDMFHICLLMIWARWMGKHHGWANLRRENDAVSMVKVRNGFLSLAPTWWFMGWKKERYQMESNYDDARKCGDDTHIYGIYRWKMLKNHNKMLLLLIDGKFNWLKFQNFYFKKSWIERWDNNWQHPRRSSH